MKYKTYIIEGKEFNAVDLSKETGIPQDAIRNRLKVATTIDELYRPLNSNIYKEHIIEGEKFTSPQVAKILNCSDSTARARLIRCTTAKELLSPLVDKTKNGKIIEYNKSSDDYKINKLLMGAW